MSVFKALLGEVDGVFGKPFFLAGLLPAGLLVFALTWFEADQGIVDLAQELEQIVSGEVLGRFTAFFIVALIVALVFFAARGWTMMIVESVPGKVLVPLNGYLTRRQEAGRMAAIEAQRAQDFTVSILAKWATRGGFSRPRFVPKAATRQKTAVAIAASVTARDTISTLLRCNRETVRLRHKPLVWLRSRFFRDAKTRLLLLLPNRRQSKLISEGLRALYCAYVYAMEDLRGSKQKSDSGSIVYRPSSDTKASLREIFREIRSWMALVEIDLAHTVLEALRDDAHRQRVRLTSVNASYPSQGRWVAPTKLGSLAASLDDYAEKRYGIDTSTMLTRLTGVLEDSVKAGLSDARLSVEVMLNFALSMCLLALYVFGKSVYIVGSHLVTLDWSSLGWHPKSLAFLPAAGFLAFVFYRGALFAYSGMVERIVRAVDLNRLKLVEALGLSVPKDMQAELQLWKDLGPFLLDGHHLKPSPPIKAQSG